MTRDSIRGDLAVIAINLSGRYSGPQLTGGGKRYIELMNQISACSVPVWWIGPRPTAMLLGDSVNVVTQLTEVPKTRETRGVRIVVIFDEADFREALRVTRYLGARLIVFPRGNKLVHNPRGAIVNFAKKLLISWFYSQADALVFQTKAQADEFRELFKVKRPVYILPNSLRTSWIPSKPPETVPKMCRRVGFIGDRSHRKGFDIFASAAARLSELELEFHCAGLDRSGDDPPNVQFWGYQKDVSKFLSKIDLLVVPSRYDSFPNVLLEAVASDVPVLVSDTPILRDIVRYPELIFGNSANELAGRLRQLVENEDAYRAIVQKSRDIRELYDFDWGAEAIRIFRQSSTVN